MPSNGTEGMIFQGAFCEQCIHERWIHHQDEDKDEDKCEIWSDVMINAPDPNPHWIYDEDGWPYCTEYKHFDWGDEDDPNEPGDDWPYPPIPVGPNQLSLFPLEPTEKDFDDKPQRIQTGSQAGETRKEKAPAFKAS